DEFKDVDGGPWKQGWRVNYKGDEWNDERLKVFVVPHSHNDPGWKLTVEEYYDRQSRHILDTIVDTLVKEEVYMGRDVLLGEMVEGCAGREEEAFTRLLQNGQLEIVGGGWVMNDEIKQEISTMKLIRHPNVIRMFEVMASKTKIYMVLEFVTGGELFDKIAAEGRLKEDEARKYFQQLINAVDYCHSRGVFHRDLKPENLLLDASGCLKVSDFGLSALPQQVREDGLLHTTCGTPNYVAPEVINNKGYDGAKADLWSCGVILFVLIAGYLPFEESNHMALCKK
ncbi:hypothetical protein M8C21_022633, partial [Ambrosia artemisiifolia]